MAASKAFERVTHNIIIAKLGGYRVDKQDQRKTDRNHQGQRVVANGTKSDWWLVTSS